MIGSAFILLFAAMLAQAQPLLDTQVQKELDDEMFLGCVVIAGRPEQVVCLKAYGEQDTGQPMRIDSIFDVSSITKAATLASTLAITMTRHPRIQLDDLMRQYLPGMTGAGSDQITIRHTATHRSGLDNTKSLQAHHQGEELVNEILRRDVAYPVGSRYAYSCLGMIRMSEMIAAINGQEYGELIQSQLFDKLGMDNSFMVSVPPALRGRAVRARTVEPGVAPMDENARRIGRAVGNAGLFTTAEDLSKVCTLWLQKGRYDGERLFSEQIAEQFTRKGIIWKTGNASTEIPNSLSPQVYYHTGYNGHSLIVDPINRCYVIVLTNWHHPAISVTNATSDLARARIAEAVIREYGLDRPPAQQP